MPTLTVSILTRNEQANLPDAIASVQAVADQLHVTDTGSTDDTVAIAESMGVSVDSFTWIDDFAAAWNHRLSRIETDWVLLLDADERVLPESHETLRRCLDRGDVLAYDVIRRDVIDNAQPERYTRMTLPRLFRNHQAIRFVGRCHPHPEPALDQIAGQNSMILADSGVELLHFGYTAELRPAKLQRGARLLALELADRPGQPYYLVELMRTYLLMRDPRAATLLAESAEALGPHLEDEHPPWPSAALLLETMVQWPADRLPRPWSAKQVRDLVERWYPDAAPLLWLLAGQDFAAGRYQQAADRLRKLIQMGRDHSYDHHSSFDPAIVSGEAQLNLAACLIKLARLPEAKRLLKPLRSHPALRERAIANLQVVESLSR